MRLSLKKSYVGHGLKHVLACKKDFTDALLRLVPHLEDEKGAKVTKNNITRQSRLVPTLIFEVSPAPFRRTTKVHSSRRWRGVVGKGKHDGSP